MSVAGLPLFEAHSEPLPKKRERKPAVGWEGKQPGRCADLRALLSDGKWHPMGELREVAGWRYGARLLEIRRGLDGWPPIAVEKRREGDLWLYRLVRR